MIESIWADEEKTTMSAFDTAEKIHDHIADCTEASRKGETPAGFKVQPIPLGDYVNACHECLPVVEVLTADLLRLRMDAMIQSDDAEMLSNFPPGMRCCVTVIPVTPRGSKLEVKDMRKGSYQTRLIVEKDTENAKGRTIEGFSMEPSYIFHMLPEEVQKQCTFEIPQYDPANPDDRQKIMDLYAGAFKSAQLIFNRKKDVVYS